MSGPSSKNWLFGHQQRYFAEPFPFQIKDDVFEDMEVVTRACRSIVAHDWLKTWYCKPNIYHLINGKFLDLLISTLGPSRGIQGPLLGCTYDNVYSYLKNSSEKHVMIKVKIRWLLLTLLIIFNPNYSKCIRCKSVPKINFPPQVFGGGTIADLWHIKQLQQVLNLKNSIKNNTNFAKLWISI